MFMKFAKLLGVGTSFFGGGKKAAYRLNQRGGLPKFNDGKNPFAPKPPEAAPEPPKEQVVAPVVGPAPKALAAYAFKPVGKSPAPPSAKGTRPGWTTRLNPFRAPEPMPAQPPRAVQAELSLEGVKVVHNDLADAEVEVVPVKARANAPVPAPMLPPARQAWEYLGEKMLKSS
jgi:hypothetical protein